MFEECAGGGEGVVSRRRKEEANKIIGKRD